MTHDLYFDTYKQYKAGTSKLVTWLAKTAKACGASGLDPTSNSKATKLTLPVKEFVRLAKTIVNSTTAKIEVPKSIIDVLDEVIAARKKCARWFQGESAVPASDDSKDGHQHFIQILEQVLEILTPGSEETPRAKRAAGKRNKVLQSQDNASSNCVEDTLSNVFEYLTVEEPIPSSLTEEQTPPEKKMKRKDKVPQVTYEIETSEDDLVFGIFCFFVDCLEIRRFLHVMWLQWRFGRCSLTTASLVTNLALDVIRRMHKDFVEAFPQFSTHERIDSFLAPFMLLHIHHRLSGLLDGPSRLGDKNSDLLDEHGPEALSGETVYLGLRQFIDCEKKGESIDFHPRLLNPDLSKIEDTFHHRLGILSRGVVDCLLLMTTWNGSMPVADEFSYGLWIMHKEHQVPTWLVVAGEIFLDLHYTLREDIRRGFGETQATADRALQTLRGYFKYARSLAVGRTPNWTEKFLLQLPVFVKHFIYTDHVTERRRVEKRHDQLDLPPYYLLAHNPVLCGLITFHMDRILHYGGIRLANSWQVILATAHLYNAARQCGYLETQWPDIEAVISMHSARHLFVGDLPKSFNECCNRFWLAFGVSPRAFARNARLSAISDIQSAKRRRRLDTCTPILDICRARYRTDGKALDGLTLHDIETVLNTAAEPGSDHKSTNVRRGLSAQWNQSHRLSPIQLLKALQEGINEEEFRLHFDYISLNKRCIELLKSLRAIVQEKFDHLPWPEVTNNDSDILSVVCIIFCSVSIINVKETVRCEGTFPLAPGKGNDFSPFLETAGSVIRSVIEKEGDVEIKKARALNGRRKDGRDMVEVLRAEEFHDFLGFGWTRFLFPESLV